MRGARGTTSTGRGAYVARYDAHREWARFFGENGWTRSQRIRTAGELEFEAALVEGERPVYEQIADEAVGLREEGLTFREIARRFGVTDKTVRRAVASREGELDEDGGQ